MPKTVPVATTAIALLVLLALGLAAHGPISGLNDGWFPGRDHHSCAGAVCTLKFDGAGSVLLRDGVLVRVDPQSDGRLVSVNVPPALETYGVNLRVGESDLIAGLRFRLVRAHGAATTVELRH